MSGWLLAIAAALVAHAATTLGCIAATRFTRASLPLLLGLVLSLDVMCGLMGVAHPGIRNGLIVLTAIPLAASMASLVESRSAFAAILLAAAAVEVMTSFGGSLGARAMSSAGDDPVRSLVILLPAPGQPIVAVTLADLAMTGLAVACAPRVVVRPVRSFLAGAVALVSVVTLDRVFDHHVAHLPLIAAVLLLALLERGDRGAQLESPAS
jgi:hypothetical protein